MRSRSTIGQLFHLVNVTPSREFRTTHSGNIEFDKLLRLVQRQSSSAEPIPPFFVKTLISLESSLNAALAKEKEAKKKMNATNARALNSMKQKIRKTAKEYEQEIHEYQAVNSLIKTL